MADKSLEVKISADVSSLESQSAVARAQLNALSSNVRSLAKDFLKASDDMKSSINAELIAQVELADQAKAHYAALQAQVAHLSEETEASQGAFAKLNESFLGVGETVEGITGKITDFTGVFGKIGELVAVGFGADLIGESVEKVAENGADLLHLSEQTGISTEALSGLKLVTQEAGGSFDSFQSALLRFSKTVETAVRSPSSAAGDALKELVGSANFAKLSVTPLGDVLDEVGQALNRFADGPTKAALEMQTFGLRGEELVPILNQLQSDGGVAGATAKIQALGGAVSQASAEFDEEFAVAVADSKAGLFGIQNTILQGVIPGLSALIQGTGEASGENFVWDTALRAVEATLDGVTGTVALFVDSVKAVVAVAFDAGQELDVLVVSLKATGAAMELNFKAAAADAVEASQMQAIATATMTKSLVGDYENVIDVIKAMQAAQHAAGESTPASVNLPQAPKINVPGGGGGDGGVGKARDAQDQITQIAQDAAAARKAVAASEYDAQVANWNTEVDQGKLSKAQEVQDEIEAKNQEYAAAEKEAQQEVALAPLGTVAKAKALDDLMVLTAQHNAEIAQLNEQLVNAQIEQAKEVQQAQEEAAAKSQAAWQAAFAPITQAFDSSLNGVLQGTQTLQQAEVKAAQSIALAYIDAAAKKVVSFAVSEAQVLAGVVANELGITAAVTAGTATRLAVQTTAASTGKSIDAAASSATITNDAAKAFSGAYSAVVGIPYVGPVLAPIAGATAYAAVMAYDVLSAEGGFAVPAGVNPLVKLHENEMVLPADIAQPLNTFLGSAAISNSSTGDTHINFSQTNHGVGGDAAGALNKAQQAWMSQIIDLTRNGTLRLPGR